MMVKGDGSLDQGLKEPSISLRCVPPYVFKGFVGCEEIGAIEQRNSLRKLAGIHAPILAQKRLGFAAFLLYSIGGAQRDFYSF